METQEEFADDSQINGLVFFLQQEEFLHIDLFMTWGGDVFALGGVGICCIGEYRFRM